MITGLDMCVSIYIGMGMMGGPAPPVGMGGYGGNPFGGPAPVMAGGGAPQYGQQPPRGYPPQQQYGAPPPQQQVRQQHPSNDSLSLSAAITAIPCDLYS